MRDGNPIYDCVPRYIALRDFLDNLGKFSRIESRLIADSYCPLGDYVSVLEVNKIRQTLHSVCEYCGRRGNIHTQADAHTSMCEFADVKFY